jgi:hypothetical protein
MESDGAQSGTYHGHGPKLHDAIEDAWEKAKGPGRPTSMKVLEITVEGSNPITGYGVILGPS